MRLLPRHPEEGWLPYVWLVYSGFFLIGPVMGRTSPRTWMLTAAGYVAFLVLYFAGYWLKGRQILWASAGILLLGAVFIPFNFGAGCFFIFAAAFLGNTGPPRFALLCLAALLVFLGLEAWLLDLHPLAWGPAAVFSLIIGGVNIHQAEVSRANARLRITQEEVERLAKAAERERIARDLHDVLGHTLSVITLKSELAGKLVDRDPDRACREIREVERISREALREVRTAIAGYRSEGLQAELARAGLALESSGVKLEYFAQPVEPGPARETVLALALKEAVTNVIRHSGARTCWISLKEENGEVRLEVRDDGRGGTAPFGIGLSSMRERVEGLGGRMERQGDDGTTLIVALPLREAPVLPFQEPFQESIRGAGRKEGQA
ncbi:MAG TPA: sensor histidine kinase [Thermoanaerobaculia bacterium]|nr:sensor histidine kinase [Thermoanaerobaculia bacterium]